MVRSWRPGGSQTDVLLPVEDDVLVGLVADEQQVVALGERGNRLQCGAVGHHTDGIVWCVDEDGARAGVMAASISGGSYW